MASPARRIIFFGTPDFAAVGLRALTETPGLEIGLVVTQPDRPAGRGNRMHASPVKTFAESRGIPVLQPERIRKHEDEFLRDVAPFGPFDIGVVIAFGQILPTVVLDLPVRGCVNVHGSLLPRWRGAAPIQRAIMSGDSATGVGLMAMEAGLDTGAVFSEERIPIANSDTFGTLHDKLAHAGAALLKRDLSAIIEGRIAAKPQPAEGITYAHKIESPDQLINWSKEAPTIADQIRALDPFPGAYTFVGGRRLKLFSPSVAAVSHPMNPGQIQQNDGRLVIGCGAGAIAPLEVQPEGKKRMPAADWLRGADLPPDSVAASTP